MNRIRRTNRGAKVTLCASHALLLRRKYRMHSLLPFTSQLFLHDLDENDLSRALAIILIYVPR